MRWKLEDKPKLGSKKYKFKFAWYPVRINNNMVWLEWYKEIWEYQKVNKRPYIGTKIVFDIVVEEWVIIAKELKTKP